LLLQHRAEESKIDSRETPEPTGLEFAAKFSWAALGCISPPLNGL